MQTKTRDDASARPLLLDTHIWLWFFEGSRDHIAPGLVGTLEDASREDRLLVSVLSVWEIAMLEVKRRLRLSMDCRAWVRRALEAPGLHLQGLTPAIAIDSTRLPGVGHADPVDRMLIATARLAGAAIVTKDAAILAYARDGHVLAIDAGGRRRPAPE
jgi:PIN domain nuclease of toxin-antitoxin system